MSAFGGKAEMTVCGNPLSRSLFGGKADIKISRPDVPWIAQLIQLPTVGDP
jgi:hypothetical protein